MALSGKPDLVLFAGPVILKDHFEEVPWTRPVVVKMVRDGQTSADFRQLGTMSFPQIVKKYTGQSIDTFRQIAISAWSKGGSFTDEVLKSPEARDRVSAVILNDAVFGDKHDGLGDYLDAAADSEKLMVVTNTNNVASSTVSMRARESVVNLIGGLEPELKEVPTASGMPIPTGGAWNLGKFFWYDYVQGNGQNDISHEAHHDLAAQTWEAFLVPQFSSSSKLPILLASATVAAVGITLWLKNRS